MAKGRLEGYRQLLFVLGRAAGLSSLAVATMASGPCGSCVDGDECATVDDLLTTREAGIAAVEAGGTGGQASVGTAGASSQVLRDVETAKAWDGTSCPSPEQYRAIVQLKFPTRYDSSSIVAKDLGNDKCCYNVSEFCAGGRPFLVHGRPRVAPVSGELAQAWFEHDELSPWLADARAEHASVAAFARLSLQLLSLGAPAALVRDAQLASLDELRHADFFFELAARASGLSAQPGPLDVNGALDDLSLAGLVESNLREGCIGETLAAAQLRRRAEVVDDVGLKAELLRIADDETRHAELAFRILAWCRDVAPDLTRQTLQRLLHDAAADQRNDETWRHVLSPLLGAIATA